MTPSPVRVLVVEDSATMRHHIRQALAADPQLQVIGEAADGAQAVDLCARLRPDVVTMDIVLPVMSGLAATEHIMAEVPTPILVVSSVDRSELYSTYAALAAGAVDVMDKPRGDASDDTWAQRLRSTVRLVSRIRVITRMRARPARPEPGAAAGPPGAPVGVVAVGASTGGPGAIIELLKALPPDFRPPVLLVQHMSTVEPFSVAFPDWLSAQTGRPVTYARGGEMVESLTNRVVMAPPDRHLIVRDGFLRLTADPPRHFCRPSVDTLFDSVARDSGSAAAGCLLTGMGRDGASGLLAMRRAGAQTFAQDEATCVVYGMPREAVLLGAAGQVLAPAQIGARLAVQAPARRSVRHR